MILAMLPWSNLGIIERTFDSLRRTSRRGGTAGLYFTEVTLDFEEAEYSLKCVTGPLGD